MDTDAIGHFVSTVSAEWGVNRVVPITVLAQNKLTGAYDFCLQYCSYDYRKIDASR